jgi:hypothetical protein
LAKQNLPNQFTPLKFIQNPFWDLKNKKEKKRKKEKNGCGFKPCGVQFKPFANELDLGVPMAC